MTHSVCIEGIFEILFGLNFVQPFGKAWGRERELHTPILHELLTFYSQTTNICFWLYFLSCPHSCCFLLVQADQKNWHIYSINRFPCPSASNKRISTTNTSAAALFDGCIAHYLFNYVDSRQHCCKAYDVHPGHCAIYMRYGQSQRKVNIIHMQHGYGHKLGKHYACGYQQEVRHCGLCVFEFWKQIYEYGKTG